MIENIHLAYLDPGSGSFFLQILLAGILGAAVWIKLSSRRIVTWLSGLFGRNHEEKGPPTNGTK